MTAKGGPIKVLTIKQPWAQLIICGAKDIENREWALHVYDRNQQQWVQVNALDAPGEKAIIKHIQVVE